MSTFIPTDDWQIVPEGTVLPPGLDIRMNLETGQNEARLMPKPKPNGHEIPHFVADATMSADQFRRKVARADLPGQQLDWASLKSLMPPRREFVLPDWIPLGAVTLLHGFGGVGKSLLAQQIGTAAAFKRQMLGGIASACPVLAWWGEDDHDEIWRRQLAINAALRIGDLAELIGKVIWTACPGDDITLFKAANESDFETTRLFTMLREQIMDLKIKFYDPG